MTTTIKFAFIERLLNLERRVCHIYQNLAANESFAAEARGFWRDWRRGEAAPVHFRALCRFVEFRRGAGDA